MSKKRFAPIVVAVLVAAFTPSTLSAEESVVIVVNEENVLSLTEYETRRLLRRLYLKERTAWPNGKRAIFFARPSTNSAEQKFREEVLMMTDASLDDHWIKLKQTKGETRPRAVGSARILLRQIQSKAYAVGVIKQTEFESLSDQYENIRVVSVLEGGRE